MGPKQIVAHGYDRIAERYIEWARYRLEERNRYTAALLEKLPNGAKVLELRCQIRHSHGSETSVRRRIVVDTNVFVSGIFWSGPPYQILTTWRDRKLELALSPAILEEYIRIALALSNRFPDIDLFPFIELLIVEAKFCMPKRLSHPVCKTRMTISFLNVPLLEMLSALSAEIGGYSPKPMKKSACLTAGENDNGYNGYCQSIGIYHSRTWFGHRLDTISTAII